MTRLLLTHRLALVLLLRFVHAYDLDHLLDVLLVNNSFRRFHPPSQT